MAFQDIVATIDPAQLWHNEWQRTAVTLNYADFLNLLIDRLTRTSSNEYRKYIYILLDNI